MRTSTALIIVDVQVGIMDGLGLTQPSIPKRDEVLSAIGQVLAKARKSKTPVLYVQHEMDDIPGYPPLRPGFPHWEVHPAVAPAPGESIITKRTSDSFYGTSLRQELDYLGVEHLVVVGCETDHCIDSTVRHAFSLDYDVTLVADGHTTNSGGRVEGLSTEMIIAHHNAALADLPHPKRTLRVVPAAEITFD